METVKIFEEFVNEQSVVYIFMTFVALSRYYYVKKGFLTWTISLTPGVKIRAAPIRVVIDSWIDSNPYTFLINPI